MSQPKPKTKILATIGPSCSQEAQLRALLLAGVDAVRMNFSHGTQADHAAVAQLVRTLSQELGLHTCLIADLQGPKIRIGRFKAGPVDVQVGDHFVFDAALDESAGDAQHVGLTYKNLPQDVAPGDILLLDDGRLEFEVNAVAGDRIDCTVRVGGTLRDNKGINRLGGGLSATSLTEKDIDDLKAAVAMGVDYIALSFPRSAQDVNACRDRLRACQSPAGVIAKIERAEAVTAMDEIIAAADAVMVARGDLGVEIGDAQVPGVQKRIIERARALNTPVITATQMLESMIHASSPTRAEVSDVANAVLDGTDAVMLSAETASGEYPIAAVASMRKICLAAEQYPQAKHPDRRFPEKNYVAVDEAIAYAAINTANHLATDAILALTESGGTALRMSRIETDIPIYALSRYAQTLQKMNLYRGVYPVAFDPTGMPRSEINRAAMGECERLGLVKSGERIIITKGDFIGEEGTTNAMKILTV